MASAKQAWNAFKKAVGSMGSAVSKGIKSSFQNVQRNGWNIGAAAGNLLAPGTPISSMLSGQADYLRQKEDTAEERLYNEALTKEGWAHSAAEADKERAWQEQMSNTAMQRQVADLKEAGLNPWLAVGGGAQVGATGTASQTSAAKAGGHPVVNLFMNADKVNSQNMATAAQVISSIAG